MLLQFTMLIEKKDEYTMGYDQGVLQAINDNMIHLGKTFKNIVYYYTNIIYKHYDHLMVSQKRVYQYSAFLKLID